MKNRITYIFVILLTINIASARAYWERSIINYNRSQYDSGAQNWMVSQAPNDWMYFANAMGLLQFDGIGWNTYKIPNGVIRSVKATPQRIYVGGSSEFGYFSPNKIGKLVYTPLSSSLKEWGGEVWNIHIGNNEVYFQDERFINIYADNKLVTLTNNNKIDCSTLINNVLYLGTTKGIFHLKNKKIELLYHFANLDGAKIIGILPYKNKLLVVTSRLGIYLVDGSKCEKVNSIADSFILKNQLFSCSIFNSKIALGSVQNGAFIFDLENKKYSEQLNMKNGLINNTVLDIYFDKHQNIWIGLDKGIAYVDLNSPIRPLFGKESLIGSGYCSAMYNNILYLGSNQGLYKKENTKTEIQNIEQVGGQIWSLLTHDNFLFCSGDNGVYVLSKNMTSKINLTGVWELYPLSSAPNYMIAGLYSGFAIIKKTNGQWAFSHHLGDYYNSSRNFIEDDIKNTLWVANKGKGIHRITLANDFSKIADAKRYLLNAKANIGNNTNMRRIDNDIVVCGMDGIYRYGRINDEFDRFTQLENMLEGEKYYSFLYQDTYKNIWFVTNDNLKMLKYNTAAKRYEKQVINYGLKNEIIDRFLNVNSIDSLYSIVSLDNAFSRIDIQKSSIEQIEPQVQINKIISTNTKDSTISYGYHNQEIELPYSLNSLKFQFVSINHAKKSDILYSYRLKGLDDKWSAKTISNTKEYTNLHEGVYTFEVKSYSNDLEHHSSITSVTFEILPPWYRSVFAYLVYILLILTAFILTYKKTISKQKKIILEKGQELIVQNIRHEEESKLKDAEIYALQNQNLKTELDYKTQELASSAMNVIRKNEILEEVKKEVVSLSKAIDENTSNMVLKPKVLRLISQINTNIEHDGDFEKFQSNFNVVYHDFFKLLDEKHPTLTRNDKLLCAYIKINLSSKEIAPLLNISLRGVEVNRYRLRKKMNLDREVNLSEYLQKL